MDPGSAAGEGGSGSFWLLCGGEGFVEGEVRSDPVPAAGRSIATATGLFCGGEGYVEESFGSLTAWIRGGNFYAA